MIGTHLPLMKFSDSIPGLKRFLSLIGGRGHTILGVAVPSPARETFPSRVEGTATRRLGAHQKPLAESSLFISFPTQSVTE